MPSIKATWRACSCGDPLRTVLIGAGSWALKEEGDRQVVLKNSQEAKCLYWSCATTFFYVKNVVLSILKV